MPALVRAGAGRDLDVLITVFFPSQAQSDSPCDFNWSDTDTPPRRKQRWGVFHNEKIKQFDFLLFAMMFCCIAFLALVASYDLHGMNMGGNTLYS